MNIKCHDILNLFLKEKCEIIYLNENKLEKFISDNNNKNIYIFFYNFLFSKKDNNFIIKLFYFINKIKIYSNIIFFTFDFWHHPWKGTQHKLYNEYIYNVFKAKNHKVICFCNDIKQLNYFHDYNYNQYKENIIFNNIWCCYNQSYCDFNKSPIYRLFISGNIQKEHYPERFILNNLKKKTKYIYRYNYNIKDYEGNNYNLNLNKYFAGFSSSVYVQSKKNKLFTNTHILLLKTFEILASGSLLVMPKKEEDYLKKNGLIHNENCYLIDFTKNILAQINYLFTNKSKYDIVRKKGYKFALENFNFKKKLGKLKRLINI